MPVLILALTQLPRLGVQPDSGDQVLMEPFKHLPADDDRAKLASQVIEGLRAKLLDLTTRNPLLNYRHSDRAKAQVRAVDELPDALHGLLTDGRSLVFRALREPDDQPEDERGDEFQIALEAERLEDQEYVEGVKRLVGDDPNNPALLTLERALRDRVRAKLGLPPRPKRAVISLADVARSQGVDPSYELPAPGGEDREAHHDSEIQTLALPDRMEAKLAALREGARRALEETGINTCFAAYGFIEWYESIDSERPLYAPLLLQPLEIERVSQQGRWRYFVKWTGEDTAINVTLAERMKQDFGLDWPTLEEDETPESYFARLTDIVQTQQRWRVRRFVTFGLFAFGRLAMWADLDPSRWPTNRQPPTHPIVAGLMAGGAGGEGAVASEYEVDSPEIASRMPPFVLDADSSQMAVVLDALAGKSLAVKGPPGTGKSQTIANLIAAALVQGKSVLFVAEKMAALEVVKSRLDGAGLGHFVLELHSTKSKKKDVLESLARRLEAQGRLAPPARIEQELAELARLRSQLNAYVGLMKQPFGATGRTVQEILWAAQRTSTVEVPASVDRVVIPAVEGRTLGDLERIQALLGQFQSVSAELRGRWGTPEQHPWAWLNRILSPFERDDLLDFVREWRGQVGKLRNLAEDCRGLVETSVNSREELRSLRAVLAKLPGTVSVEVNRQVLARLTGSADRDDLGRLERTISKRQTLHERCAAFGPTEALLGRNERISELAQLVRRLGVGDLSSDQMEQVLGQLEESRGALSAVVEAIEGLASLFEVGPSRNAATLEILLAAAQLAGATPRSALLQRRREVDSPEAQAILERAVQEVERLRDTRRQLRLAFDLDRAARSDDLRAVAQVLRHAGIFGRLGARYRRSRETWRGLIRQPRKATGQAMAADLERIADQFERERAFARDPDLVSLFGAQFAGIETDLGPVLGAARFLSASREIGASSIPTRGDIREKSRIRNVLAEAHIGILEQIAGFGIGERRKLVQQGLDALVQHSSNEILEVVQKLNEKRLTGQRLVVVLQELQIRSGLPLAHVDGLSVIVSEMTEVDQQLEELSSAVAALREAGMDLTDVSGLREALAFVGTLDIPGVPEGIRRYVLSEEIDGRLAELAGLRERLEAELDREEITARRTVSLVGISEEDSFSGVTLEALEGKLRVALEALDSIGEWSAYLKLREEVVAAGAYGIVECYGDRSPEGLPDAYARAFWRSLARKMFGEHQSLSSTAGSGIETARQRFREIDRRVLKLNQQAIAAKLCQQSIPAGTDRGSRSEWTNLALIRHQTQLQRPRIAIRDLIRRGGQAIRALKPCWMMSPISTAQFIVPGIMEFDLVVIDEASQMRPEEAVGSIARGHQVVVVGDPMQLPPTNFFDRVDGFDDEDEQDLEEESILDLALGQFQPYRHLRWHYRSRHENLIRFSNKHFYDNKLIVFPAASDDQAALGVHYYPSGGRYKGGGGNPEEAKVVAEAAIEAMRRYPHWSLGVVSVNLAQAELLRMEVDRLVLRDTAAQEYIARWDRTLEPFFVKNLENVQGDERDIIMISTVYGPNEQGQVMQRFGPINQATGHRRLNVLFTRAKCRVEVHTSLTAGQVRDGEGVSRGTNVLKAYLEYAATGRLDGGLVTGRPPESDFEVEVAEALRAKGFEVVAQVGVEGFYIDLAVKHPDYPHGYLAGVECDGATYHSAKSAKDRDVLRQEILEGLGWRLHRVWSTDWFSNRAREVNRLIQFLEGLLQQRRGVTSGSRPVNESPGQSPPSAVPPSTMPPALRPVGRANADERAPRPNNGPHNGDRVAEAIVAELSPEALTCAKCAGRYEALVGRYGPFLRCTGRCRGSMSIEVAPLCRVLQRLDIKCPACGKQAVSSRGPYGAFVGCSGYPKCPKGRRSWLDLRDELRGRG